LLKKPLYKGRKKAGDTIMAYYNPENPVEHTHRRFEVSGVVVLGLFRDPAGNPMGLVEMDGDSHVVPD